MTEKLIIYVKDENQQKELIRKHPGIDADWIDLGGQTEGMENMLPMVCTKDSKGEEVCGGEEFITQLKRKE